MRSSENYVGGSHDQFDFLLAAFVGSLRGVLPPSVGFDGRTAKFCHHLIIEFCNTIGQLRTLVLRYRIMEHYPSGCTEIGVVLSKSRQLQIILGHLGERIS